MPRSHDPQKKTFSRVLVLFGGRNCDGRPEVSGTPGWTVWADLNGIFLVAPTLKDDNCWEPAKWSGRAVKRPEALGVHGEARRARKIEASGISVGLI